MRWIEIIQLRTTGPSTLDDLVGGLNRSLAGVPLEVTIYRHATVATDLSIHLVHETEGDAEPDRTLGQRLAATLEELGLVNQSLWTEVGPTAQQQERRPS